MSASCWGVVVAAGRGERFGGDQPKALLELAGTALVVHAARALRDGGCDGVVVAAPLDLVPVVAGLLAESGLALGGSPATPTESGRADDGSLGAPPVIVVEGGATRQASVSAALAAVPVGTRWVLIHDAARPLVPAAVVVSVLSALTEGAPAVIPVLPVADTLKSVDAAGQITATVDRTDVRRAQTPQGFERDLLVKALDECGRSGHEVTDDAAAVAALGVPVLTVPGDERGFKITTPADSVLAEALLATSTPKPS